MYDQSESVSACITCGSYPFYLYEGSKEEPKLW